MSFERADGRDDDDSRGVELCLAALDIEELLCAAIEAETGLGDRPVGQVHGGFGGDDAAAAVRDVGERSSVDERRDAFGSVDQRSDLAF